MTIKISKEEFESHLESMEEEMKMLIFAIRTNNTEMMDRWKKAVLDSVNEVDELRKSFYQ